MPQWDAIIQQHADIVWATLDLLPEQLAAEQFAQTFLEARNTAHRDAVADWQLLLQRIASRRALARLREGGIDHNEDLPGTLRSCLADIPEQQALLFCLRYISELPFSGISMELRLPLADVPAAVHAHQTCWGVL